MNNGVPVIGNYKKYENKEYLRQCDLPTKGDLIATIKEFRAHVPVFDPGTKRNEERFVVFFEECKPMILNKVNRESAEKAIGTDEGDKWKGHKIAIYYDPSVKMAGRIVGGLRVRPYKPKGAAYICADCGNEITAHGSTSALEIAEGTRSKYKACLCWECASKRKGAGNE